MEVAEANLVQLQLRLVAASSQGDLCSDREQVLLAADGDVVVVRADDGLADGRALRHFVRDLGDAPDGVRGAVNVDHAVIADENHLPGTAAEEEIRVLFGDAIFENLHGSATERIGFEPRDLRFGGRPEETANEPAEDSGAGDATPRIGVTLDRKSVV